MNYIKKELLVKLLLIILLTVLLSLLILQFWFNYRRGKSWSANEKEEIIWRTFQYSS